MTPNKREPGHRAPSGSFNPASRQRVGKFVCAHALLVWLTKEWGWPAVWRRGGLVEVPGVSRMARLADLGAPSVRGLYSDLVAAKILQAKGVGRGMRYYLPRPEKLVSYHAGLYDKMAGPSTYIPCLLPRKFRDAPREDRRARLASLIEGEEFRGQAGFALHSGLEAMRGVNPVFRREEIEIMIDPSTFDALSAEARLTPIVPPVKGRPFLHAPDVVVFHNRLSQTVLSRYLENDGEGPFVSPYLNVIELRRYPRRGDEEAEHLWAHMTANAANSSTQEP